MLLRGVESVKVFVNTIEEDCHWYMSLMEAILFKTTRYDLAVAILHCRTNVSDIIVAELATQSETGSSTPKAVESRWHPRLITQMQNLEPLRIHPNLGVIPIVLNARRRHSMDIFSWAFSQACIAIHYVH